MDIPNFRMRFLTFSVFLVCLLAGCATKPLSASTGVSQEQLNTYTEKVRARMKEEGLVPEPSEPVQYRINADDKNSLLILVPMVQYRGSKNPYDWWRVELQSGKVTRLPRVGLSNQSLEWLQRSRIAHIEHVPPGGF